MDLNIAGRRALVTGGSSGLGEAIAVGLAAEGVAVVVHGRDRARTEAVAERIVAKGGAASIAIGDLTGDRSVDEVADAAVAHGPVDILVNNAGAYTERSWDDVTSADWAAAYEINVIASVRMIRRLVPGMRQRHWGRVIQIGGVFATQPAAVLPHYAATIAARHNLAVSLARELQGTGVTSNVVAPDRRSRSRRQPQHPLLRWCRRRPGRAQDHRLAGLLGGHSGRANLCGQNAPRANVAAPGI